ncbi:MAG TPA: arginine--tRNA ligase [Acidimicrobiaceae bacterium]|nr:arginine--tRNA ligase [Acidimicrobiaceae bacterium]
MSAARRYPSQPATGQEKSVIQQLLAEAVSKSLAAAGVEIAPADVRLERPARAEHGDWSTNAALAAAKPAGADPRALARALADSPEVAAVPHVVAVEVAGPGFVNFTLAPTWLHDVLRRVVADGVDGYARPGLGDGETVSVEFVSANPTGPLHAGGGRWGAYGDSLVRLFRRCGYDVEAEYYVNDRGAQVDLFARSLLARRAGEDPPADGYHGAYVADWAAEMPAELTETDAVALWGTDRALAEAAESLGALDVSFDRWQRESELVDAGAVDDVLAQLRAAGDCVYEADGATWLRTTDHGDADDRVLVKSDGESTYFLPDIAYHHDKLSRADHVVDVLGADHHGYVARMAAAMTLLGHPPDSYEAVIGQHVTLVRDGAEVPLSKRTGTMVEVRELVEAVGADVARLAYLLASIDTRQTIDIDLLTRSASENPVFYVQYAHARIASIEREAARRSVVRPELAATELAGLTEPRELAVLRCLEELPEVVETALADRAPHKVATWVRELAAAFHGFYHDCPILRSDVPEGLRDARLWLTEAARIGLAVGLDLLGVSAPEEM